MQKRHDEGDSLSRAAAILSSMDFVISSSSIAFSGESFEVDAMFSVEGVSSDEASGGGEPADRLAALSSFSLCFLD